MNADLTKRTIDDFGDQWTRYTTNEGFYGSVEMLRDILEPLVPVESVSGRSVAEIGSGTGRIVGMLLAAGARRVTALEPSDAFDVLARNVAAHADRVVLVRARGDALPPEPKHDLVVSIGVLHHIPDPAPAVAAAFSALKPSGRMVAWLYGREGNGLYLALALPMRTVTTRLPHAALRAVCGLLDGLLGLYIAGARRLPLPMRAYMTQVLGRMPASQRRLVIYDQLNPTYAKYYTRAEACALLEAAGFVDVEVHHRHGYSWTVTGRKPGATLDAGA